MSERGEALLAAVLEGTGALDEDELAQSAHDRAYATAFGAVADLLKLDDEAFLGKRIGPTFSLSTLLMIAVDVGWQAAGGKTR